MEPYKLSGSEEGNLVCSKYGRTEVSGVSKYTQSHTGIQYQAGSKKRVNKQ